VAQTLHERSNEPGPIIRTALRRCCTAWSDRLHVRTTISPRTTCGRENTISRSLVSLWELMHRSITLRATRGGNLCSSTPHWSDQYQAGRNHAIHATRN